MVNLESVRNTLERMILWTSRVSVDAILKESQELIERLKKTQHELRRRSARYTAQSLKYDRRAAEDRTHAERAAKVIAKLEDIFS